MVWQVSASSSGVWAFYCHIAWHVSTGLLIDVMENPNAERAETNIEHNESLKVEIDRSLTALMGSPPPPQP